MGEWTDGWMVERMSDISVQMLNSSPCCVLFNTLIYYITFWMLFPPITELKTVNSQSVKKRLSLSLSLSILFRYLSWRSCFQFISNLSLWPPGLECRCRLAAEKPPFSPEMGTCSQLQLLFILICSSILYLSVSLSFNNGRPISVPIV